LNTSALLRLPRDEDKRARSRRRIESIHNAAERMDHMMSDLLDCASIDRNQLRLEAKPCGVRALIAESIDAVEALAQEKELELAYEINDGIEDLVCDRERVMRVLLNLLWNAIDFTPDHGKVIVRAGRQGEDVRICVTDGGPGVPRDVRERIFERHWRARGAAHLGHGLGLFIAHGIVVAHGGHIWVDDAPGCGAVFAFTIPVRIPDPLPPFGSEPPSLRIEAGE
jgi:signal transduction histidine kinase